jgi:hypothetical protein
MKNWIAASDSVLLAKTNLVVFARSAATKHKIVWNDFADQSITLGPVHPGFSQQA